MIFHPRKARARTLDTTSVCVYSAFYRKTIGSFGYLLEVNICPLEDPISYDFKCWNGGQRCPCLGQGEGQVLPPLLIAAVL